MPNKPYRFKKRQRCQHWKYGSTHVCLILPNVNCWPGRWSHCLERVQKANDFHRIIIGVLAACAWHRFIELTLSRRLLRATGRRKHQSEHLHVTSWLGEIKKDPKYIFRNSLKIHSATRAPWLRATTSQKACINILGAKIIFCFVGKGRHRCSNSACKYWRLGLFFGRCFR